MQTQVTVIKWAFEGLQVLFMKCAVYEVAALLAYTIWTYLKIKQMLIAGNIYFTDCKMKSEVIWYQTRLISKTFQIYKQKFVDT